MLKIINKRNVGIHPLNCRKNFIYNKDAQEVPCEEHIRRAQCKLSDEAISYFLHKIQIATPAWRQAGSSAKAESLAMTEESFWDSLLEANFLSRQSRYICL